MGDNNYLISKEYCRVSYRNETENRPEYDEGKRWCKGRKVYSHYGMFHKLMNFLQEYGFTVTKDPDIEKNYKCLSKDHRYGRKGSLEFKAHRYPAGFEINFFQNEVFKNPCGGEYDFDKLEKMPYLVKLTMFATFNKIASFFDDKEIKGKEEVYYRLTEDRIKNDFVECCHHPQVNMNFSLSDLDGTTYERYNSTDRDKKIIHDGEIKYYRDWDGCLRRGKVYHRLNNMWWVIVNKYEWTNIADYELFDATEEDLKLRRYKKPVVPKECLERKENIRSMSDKELLRELKRRQLA